jgi:hypothetical protein
LKCLSRGVHSRLAGAQQTSSRFPGASEVTARQD